MIDSKCNSSGCIQGWIRSLTLLGVICILAGVALAVYGESLPVYTDPDAPGRLSLELQENPRDVRFSEWAARLKTFETPHKQLSDLGRGLWTLGVGVMLSLWLWKSYHRLKGKRRIVFFIAAWCGLWAIRIPGAFWYYSLRQKRFDYPSWGDSIAIPVFSEIFATIVGCVVLGGIFIILMSRHALPDAIRFRKPIGVISWIRCAFLVIWLLLFLESIVSGIPDGDESAVISGLGMLPLILAVLWAQPKRRPLEATPPVSAQAE